MVTPETRVIVDLPSHREVMDQIKMEVLKVVGEQVVDFQEEHFGVWFGEPWQRQKDARGIIRCPRCANSPGFERRGGGEGASTPAMGGWQQLFSGSPAKDVVALSLPSLVSSQRRGSGTAEIWSRIWCFRH